MRLLKIGIVIVAAYCILHVLLVFNADPLFPHRRTYKNFTVHMRAEIPPEITTVLDRVETLLSKSELNDPRLHHEVYLVNSFRLSRLLLLRNVHFGCNLLNDHTFITMADVVNDIARCEKISAGDRRIRTLSESIAHEITHALIRNRIGWFADRRVPVWIKEGYCEFVAEGSAIDQRTGFAMLTSETPAFTPGLNNFRYRLAVQYLINVKRMTIGELINDPPSFHKVDAAVLAGLREDQSRFLERLDWRVPPKKPIESSNNANENSP